MAVTISGGGGLQSGATNLSGGRPIAQGSPGVKGSPGAQGASPKVAGSSVLIPTATSVAKSGAQVQQAQSQGDALAAQTRALLPSIAQSNQRVYAPALNTSAIYSRANSKAAANVNPYYTKLLHEFVGQQAVTKQQQQKQTDVNIQNLNDQLAQTQQANLVTGQRATQATATNEAQIAQNADNRQVDQGTQFNTDRNALAIQEAGAGLTGSGLSTGVQASAQKTQDTTETRQAQTDQEAKDAAELSKAQTFEDLATSNTNATSAATKGVTQAKFDLNKFITGQTSDLKNERQSLEVQRQGALATERQNQTRILVSNFINSIANPAQRQAAYGAYGGLL